MPWSWPDDVALPSLCHAATAAAPRRSGASRDKHCQLMYTTYVRPILDYGDIVYHGRLTVADSLSLEEIQNRAARLITGACRNTSNDKPLKELGWTTLRRRREINILLTFNKIKPYQMKFDQSKAPVPVHRQLLKRTV